MAEENRSMEEIVESALSASQSGSGHRPVGPFGPIPKNSGMEKDGVFKATPIVHGEMPRRQSNTSAVSAAYHTVQGSGSEHSQSLGYQTTRGDDSEPPDADADTDEEGLLPSKLTNPFKSYAYWSRTSMGNSDASARTSVSEHQRKALPTSGESSRSEPRVLPSSRGRLTQASPRGSRALDMAEAMTYDERQRTGGRASSGSSRYRNMDGISSGGGVTSGGRSSSPDRKFPFQLAESGHSLKVNSSMVAYQDKNMAILVADPQHTRLRVKAKEKKAKSTGSATDRMSAEIHASYDNLSATGGQREIREVSGGSRRDSQHSTREVFYETSEHEQQQDWSAGEAGFSTSQWEAGSSPVTHQQETASHRGSRHSVVQGGGSPASSLQRQAGLSERSRAGGSTRAGSQSHRSSVSGRRVSGSGGGPGGSSSESGSSDAGVGSQRDGTATRVQRALQPTDGAGEFTTRFTPGEPAPVRRANSATSAYGTGAAVGQHVSGEFVTIKAPDQGQGGYYRGYRSTDEAGYPRRASGDWRRRTSTVTMVEDEICDLEEREEVYSGPVKENLPRPRQSGGQSSAGGQRYSAASGGRSGQKRELGMLAADAARSASETDCVILVDGEEVECSSWAVRQYSRYLQQLGSTSPRRISLPRGSATVSAVKETVRWCYASAGEASRMVTPDNCSEIYQAARALDIPELMDQCEGVCSGLRSDSGRSGASSARSSHGVSFSLQGEQTGDRWADNISVEEYSDYGADTSDGYAKDTSDGGDLYNRQSRRRSSSLGRRPYERMYTEEEVEAATKIQAGYRGFRARQELKKYGPAAAGRVRSRRFSRPSSLAPRDSEYAPPAPRDAQHASLAPRDSEYAPPAPRNAEHASLAARDSMYAPPASRQFTTKASVHLRAQAEMVPREDSVVQSRLAVSRPLSSSSGAAQRYQEEVQHRLQTELSQKSAAKIRQKSQTSISPRSRSSLSPTAVSPVRQPSAPVRPSVVETRASASGQWRNSRASIGEQAVPDTRSRSPARSRSQSPGRSQVSFSTAGGGSRRSVGEVKRRSSRHSSPSRAVSSGGGYSRSSASRAGGGRHGFSNREDQAALVIQRNYRAYSGRVNYEDKRYAAATIQRYLRGYLARKHMAEMRQAAVKIQTCFRDHLHAKRGAIDPSVDDTHGVHGAISSSSDWKCRTVLYPEGGTTLVMAGLNPMKDYCAKYNTGRDMYRFQTFQNAWEYVGQVPEPRHHATLAHLRGLVYLLGGTDPRLKDPGARCRALDTVWILDPTTGNWWVGPPMKHARIHHGTVVAQGQLYVIGGQDAAGRALTSVEVYDPDADAWKEIAPMGCGRLGVAAAVHHHRIWVVGGMCPAKTCDVVCTVDIYDTIRKRWCQGPPLRRPRCFARLVVSAQRLFLVGGAGRTTRHQKNISSLDTLERFEEEQRAWVHVAQMKSTRHGHACVPCNDQEFLILGGVSSQDVAALDLVEQYNARTNNWVRGVARLPSPLSGLAAVTIPQKKIR